MDEIEHLKQQNANLLLALQQTRNATLEEAAMVCDRESNQDPGHNELATAIRSMKDDTRVAASAAGLIGDWQVVMDEVRRATQKFPTWPNDPLHAVAILGEEFGELTKAVL